MNKEIREQINRVKNWKQFTNESIDWRNCKTAIIALFNGDNQLLALRRGDTSPWMPGYWNITGGIIEEGETPSEAAKREVKEESGLIPRDLKSWGWVDTSSSPDACGIIYYFTGRVDNNPSSSDGENSQWKFIDREELNQLKWVPFITDFSGCDLSNAKFKKSFLNEVWN